MKLIKAIACIMLVFVYSVCAAYAENKIAAVVGEHPITTLQLENRMRAIIVLNNIDTTKVDVSQIRRQVIDSLIQEVLVEEFARKHKIGITEDMVQNAVEQFAESRRMTPEALGEFLRAKDILLQDLESMLRAQITWSKVIREVVDNDAIHVSEREVIEQFNIMRSQQDSDVSVRLKLAEITVNEQSGIQGLIDSINSGADFAALAKDFSVSYAREDGGVIGWVQLSQLAPDLVALLKDLPVGHVSTPLKKDGNLVIFKILDKEVQKRSKVLGVVPTDEEKTAIVSHLQIKKHGVKVKELLEQIKSTAFTEIKLQATIAWYILSLWMEDDFLHSSK